MTRLSHLSVSYLAPTAFNQCGGQPTTLEKTLNNNSSKSEFAMMVVGFTAIRQKTSFFGNYLERTFKPHESDSQLNTLDEEL